MTTEMTILGLPVQTRVADSRSYLRMTASISSCSEAFAAASAAFLVSDIRGKPPFRLGWKNYGVRGTDAVANVYGMRRITGSGINRCLP